MPGIQGIPGFEAYEPDLLNTYIQGGNISITHPETGEPVIGVTPDGQPITPGSLAAMAAMAPIGTGAPVTIDYDQRLKELEAQNAIGQSAAAVQQAAWPEDPRETQFGNDMAWLDPLFQQDPTNAITTAQGMGTTADPRVAAAQESLLRDVWSRGNTADPTAAAGQASLTSQVMNRGLTADAATESAQRGLAHTIGARGTTADAESEAAQRSLAAEIAGRGTTADSQSEGTQRSVIDELLGIYQQGGLTDVERNRRAQARADVEGWLKGQREADMADLAERGLSGGGAELATLLGDRQAAASRLSAADLQTSADSEMRALEALMGGGDLATTMRGQADEYEATNTAERARLLDAMRGLADDFVLGNTAELNRLYDSMRGRADDFAVNNANTARGLLADQRQASDAYMLDNTRIAGTLLGDMRSSADAYQQGNARMIADIQGRNTDYLRNAQQQMLNNRQRWDENVLGLQTGVAQGTRAFDADQNQAGWNYGYNTADADANRWNSGQAAANQSAMGAFTGMSGPVAGAGNTVTGLTGNRQRSAGEGFSAGANVAGNIVSGIFGGGGGNMTGDSSRYGDDDEEA